MIMPSATECRLVYINMAVAPYARHTLTLERVLDLTLHQSSLGSFSEALPICADRNVQSCHGHIVACRLYIV